LTKDRVDRPLRSLRISRHRPLQSPLPLLHAGAGLRLPQRPGGQGPGTFAIRAALPPAALATLIKQTLHHIAPSLPVVSMTTLADHFDGGITTDRLLADIAAFFGLMSLLLVAIGMYGTLASSLTQRQREFGVRRALGASDRELARMIVLRALRPVALGLLVGLPSALLASRLAQSVLFGVTPQDPATYVWSAGRAHLGRRDRGCGSCASGCSNECDFGAAPELSRGAERLRLASRRR
jgi:FtsX-like permease family protein